MPRSDISPADRGLALYKIASASLPPHMRTLVEALALGMAAPLRVGVMSDKPEDQLSAFVAMRLGVEIHSMLDDWNAKRNGS